MGRSSPEAGVSEESLPHYKACGEAGGEEGTGKIISCRGVASAVSLACRTRVRAASAV